MSRAATLIELDELGPPTELPLTPGEGRLLAASQVVTAVPSPYQPGIWHVAAANQQVRPSEPRADLRPAVDR